MDRVRTHPGEVLLEEFLRPLGLSMTVAAGRIAVSRSRLGAIAAGRRPVDAEMAPRLARLLGTTPEFWTNLRTAHDISRARIEKGAEIDRAVRVLSRDAA